MTAGPETFAMFVTTQEQEIGLFTNKCPGDVCQVPKRYDGSKSETLVTDDAVEFVHDPIALYMKDQRSLSETIFEGSVY